MIKIIQDNNIVDVVKFPTYITILKTGHIATADKAVAMGVVGSDGTTIYKFSDKPLTKVQEVSEKEFVELLAQLEKNQSISADSSALQIAKNKKLRELSDICKTKIIEGFSIKLLDDNYYNFKLTTEDQLNLMLIESQINKGESFFIYHSTNEPCKIYMKEDMIKIIDAFRKHVLYHTTYFNAAKQYLSNATDISLINNFTYGTDIAKYVNNNTIKQILLKGGIS